MSSTHPPEVHSVLLQKAQLFGGLAVYRDSLRVMPYGRADADLFNLEERRGKHAGREFWSHRRCFGRVAFTRDNNPNLIDKAGREGLVDNRARREMRILVIAVLMDFARRFFGSVSDIRKELLPEVLVRNKKAKESADKVRKQRRKNFRKFLRENKDKMHLALEEIHAVQDKLTHLIREEEIESLILIADQIDIFISTKEEPHLPPLPSQTWRL